MADSKPVYKAEKTGVPPSANNLLLRVISAAVLAPVALVAAYLGGLPFAVFWGVAALVVLWEWMTLVVGPNYRVLVASCAAAIAVADFLAWLGKPVTALFVIGLGALAGAIFAPGERRLWVVAGTGYAGGMVLAPVFLRADSGFGFALILLLFAIVWTTDVVGYFAGRAFGGPKLWPAISPKKTWSGAVCGTVGAIVIALFVAGQFGLFDRIATIAVALLLSVVAQAGDLFESWVKRRFNAKDSSHIIPGHGGVMDRLDGFWAAAVVGCVVGVLRGGFDEPVRGVLIW
ncbi:MAG TPA: phosphatidate cytidylyltransferase [Pseudolabrys sp.]|nr:phosphatidate cytidylyltransferase [Pseudolabrys sp.]